MRQLADKNIKKPTIVGNKNRSLWKVWALIPYFKEFHRLSCSPAKSREKNIKSREKILTLLKQDPSFTTRKLAEAIGITPKAIEKQLAKLKAEGLIERDGPDKGGKWKTL